ncbi:hypothetical protein [Megalodesulfovibrio paquesii]
MAAASVSDLADFDLWGYMAFGRLFWTAPGFPRTDPFSYLPTRELWIYHEWLTGVLLYPLYAQWGGPALQLLKYLIIGSMVYAVYRGARIRGASPCSVLLLMVLWSPFIAFGFSPIRAQAFTYLFFAITLLLLEWCRLRNSMRPLWMLTPLMLVWANLHGGFLSGLAMPGIYCCAALLQRRSAWPYALAGAAAGLVTLCNPYGLAYWHEMLDAVTLPRSEIVEWKSVLFMLRGGEYQGHALLFCALALVAAALCLPRDNRKDPALGVLLITGYMAASHVRHLVFFALAFGIYAPSMLDTFLASLKENSPASPNRWRWLGLVWLCVPPLLLADTAWQLAGRLRHIHPLTLAALEKTTPHDNRLFYPVGAVRFLKDAGLCGNILSNFAWGEYLLWELAPACRIGIDGRYETVYPPEITAAYFDFMYGRAGGMAFLEQWPHDLLLFASSDDMFHTARRLPGWVLVYADPHSRLFARQTFLDARGWNAPLVRPDAS